MAKDNMTIDANAAFDFLMRHAHPHCEDLRNDYYHASEGKRHEMYEPYRLRYSVDYILPEEVMDRFREYESQTDCEDWMALWEQLVYPETQYAALMYTKNKLFLSGLYAQLQDGDSFRIDKSNLILFEWFEKIKKEGADIAEQIRIVEQQANTTQQDIDKANHAYENWKNSLPQTIEQHLTEYVKYCGDKPLLEWSNYVHDIDSWRDNKVRESQVVAVNVIRAAIIEILDADKLGVEAKTLDEYVFLLSAQLKDSDNLDKDKLKETVANCLRWLKDLNYKGSITLTNQLARKCEIIAEAWSKVSEKYGSSDDEIMKQWRICHTHYEGWNISEDEYHSTIYNVIMLYIMILVTVKDNHFDNSGEQEEYLLWITNTIIKQLNSSQRNSVLADMYHNPLSLVLYVSDKSFPKLKDAIYGIIVEGISPIFKMLSLVENRKDSLPVAIRQRIIERYEEEQPLWTPIMESRSQQAIITRQKHFVDELKTDIK